MQGAKFPRLVSTTLFALTAAIALVRTVSAQAPIITPSDISTPTPTPLILSTPTQQPATLPQAILVSPSQQPAARSIHALDATPITYTVQPGDTLFTIALEMGLDLDDAPCAVRADFAVDQPLVIGDVLSAPPANVVCHEVQPGETVESIAAIYFVDAGQIRALAWNRLTGDPDRPLTAYTHLRVPLAALTPGQPASDSDLSFLLTMLNMPVNTSPFVVFAQKSATRTPESVTVGPVPADWPYGSGRFTWPVYGWLSQNYRFDHRAVDIAAPQGTPVTASDRGVVLRAGWNNQGYGRFVIIDHKIDYVTLYAHLDRVLVKEGEIVGQGQVIGTVGSTGNSTGPHLHFEIRDFGRLTNPLELLTAP
ncbi:MAG: peptidoglycan DD-metalloendopeptidase family protein [Caldilinea sp.]